MQNTFFSSWDITPKRLLAFFMIMSLFVSFKYQNLFGFADFYYHYILYVFVLFFGISRLSQIAFWKHKLFKFYLIIFSASFVAFIFQPFPIVSFVKQFSGFVFIGLTWFVFFNLSNKNKQLLFEIYVGIALVAAFLTIPEQLLHQFGVHITPKKGGWLGLFRCYSFTEEPFSLAMLLLPALAFYNQQLATLNLGGKIRFVVLLIGLFFTFSGSGWLVFGLYLSIHLLLFKNRNILYFAFKLLLLTALSFGFLSYSGTQTRVKESLKMATYFADLPNVRVLNEVNTSTRALYLNSIVAYNQIKHNPLTGGGLGSHGTAYYRIVQQPLESNGIQIAHYNQLDGGSGFIRLLSEFGLVGLAFILYLFYLIFTFEIQSLRIPFALFWMAYLIHSGNYFLHGTFFWLMMLLYNTQSNKAAQPIKA